MDTITINGLETSADLSLSLRDWGDLYGRAGVDRGFLEVPGMLGAHPMSRAAGRVKTLPIRATLKPASKSVRQSTVDTLLAHLDGLLEVERSDATDRVYWALADQAEIRNRLPLLSRWDAAVHVDLDLGVPWGIAVAKEPTILALPASTRVELPAGTATSALFIVIPGGATDPSVTYRAANGQTIDTLTLDGTLASDETLRVETGRRYIALVDETDGSEVSGMSYFDASLTASFEHTSGRYPVLDPGHGAGGAGPTLELSDAGYCYYWKTFE